MNRQSGHNAGRRARVQCYYPLEESAQSRAAQLPAVMAACAQVAGWHTASASATDSRDNAAGRERKQHTLARPRAPFCRSTPAIARQHTHSLSLSQRAHEPIPARAPHTLEAWGECCCAVLRPATGAQQSSSIPYTDGGVTDAGACEECTRPQKKTRLEPAPASLPHSRPAWQPRA